MIIKISNITDMIGLFIGIITLLSGSALGFLISQIWFFIFNHIIKMQCITDKRPSYKILKDNFPDFQQKDELFSLMNYILTSKINKNMTIFITRKNDLFSSFGTTICSILSGLIIGFKLKKYVFIVTPSQFTFVNWQCYYVILIFLIIIILLLLVTNLIRIWFELDSMACLLLNSYIETLESDSTKNKYIKKRLRDKTLKDVII